MRFDHIVLLAVYILVAASLVALSSCGTGTIRGSDIMVKRCWMGKLYQYRYNDPEQDLIPIYRPDGKQVRCPGHEIDRASR